MNNTPSRTIAYLLWLVGIFGILGLHRFYLGRWVTGIIWFFTLGVFGIGALIDLFMIPALIRGQGGSNTNQNTNTININVPGVDDL